MRKINKDICLAIEYHNWQPAIGKKYYSSHKYYKDVLCSLINCQEGLCAYTEYRLISNEFIEQLADFFDENGRFTDVRPELPMDIEHFDSLLKQEQGWSWDNLFGVFNSINRDVKRIREAELCKNGESVFEIFKPDNPEYDPHKYLKYDIEQHMFYPNPELDSGVFDEIKKMIYVLGLNYGFIRMKRKEYLSEYLKSKEYMNEPQINQFHTAIELIS